MKTIVIMVTFTLAGLVALPAQAQMAGWITACGNADYNAFGTAECPAKEIGDFMQTLGADSFALAEAGLDTHALGEVFRLLGKVVSNKATFGCRDEDYTLLFQGVAIWNEKIDLPISASGVDTELFDSLTQVADNGAEYVLEGC